jgi:hydroxyacylglutathione hydrolase
VQKIERPFQRCDGRLYTDKVNPELIHEILPVGVLQCNCSILGDPATREAIVIDPGDETERILQLLQAHKLNVRAILSTHTHIDHVGGLAALHRATGAPVLIHEADLKLYRNVAIQAQFLGVRTPETTQIKDFVKEGDTIRWGDYAAGVIHTPGHTPGSISLLIRKENGGNPPANAPSQNPQHAHQHPGDAARLVAGDTLFQGSIGRTDLWGGSMKDILSSIREKLLVLPDETLVIPGHGELTTIGAERAENPFLR